MNNINIGDSIVFEKREYIVLDKIEYDGMLYYFVNEIISNIPSDNFLISYINNDKMIFVEEEGLLDKLLLIFTSRIK